MQHNDYYYFGKIIKSKGFEGQFIVGLEVDKPDNYKSLTEIYIEQNRELVKHNIEKIEVNKNNTATIQINQIKNADDVRTIQHCDIYLPLTLLPKLNEKRFYFHEIVGYAVIDKNYGEVGIAKEVIEHPHQNLLLVKNGFREALVPLWENVIAKVDRTEKKLFVNTPEGIIESYLTSEDEEE
jgi:16S rRNA processing protein RimM